jgi:hypothetical protein
MTGITTVVEIDKIIAMYLKAPTLHEFFIALGLKEDSERTNSLTGVLSHALAS